jgi:hypothetical protein
MVITLQEVFREFAGSYPGVVTDFEFYHVNAWIADSFIEIRNEAIDRGQADEFAITVNVSGFTQDPRLPYMKQAKIKRPVVKHTHYDDVVIFAVARKHQNLAGTTQEVPRGTRKWYDKSLYETDVIIPADTPGQENLLFENRDVRPYFPANDLRYRQGNVVYHQGQPYRLNVESWDNNTAETPDTLVEWDPVYWRRVGIGFTDPEIIDFDEMDRKKVSIDTGASVLSFNRQLVYVSRDIINVTLRYVPELDRPCKYGDEFVLPDNALPFWRSLVHQKMAAAQGLLAGGTDEQ